MSTTSKLEEAEHKVQTLQTGVIFFILVKLMQGGLRWVQFGPSPGAPGPPLIPVALRWGTRRRKGSPRSRVPQRAPASLP